MRALAGSLNSWRYIRTTSFAALLTNKSTSSRSPAIRRHSLKKCPDPVRAQPQRGVLTLTIGWFPSIRGRSLDPNTRAGAVTDRYHGRVVVGRSQNGDRKRHRLEKPRKLVIHDPRRDQIF